MKKLRNLIERYERWFMLGLVIFLLVTFTVASDIAQALKPSGGDHVVPTDVAGSFQVVPAGEPVQVTFRDFNAARHSVDMVDKTYRGLTRTATRDDIKDSAVWTQLILLEAARREGITVGDGELVDMMREIKSRLDPQLNDPRFYTEWVQRSFGVKPIAYEEAFRKALIADRVRDLYRDSFLIAPPATREKLLKQYMQEDREFARISWIALDAKSQLQQATDQFKADAEPDKTLEEFFKTDATVKGEQDRFRHPRRYNVEILYAIHKNVASDEAYARIETLFAKAYPDLDMAKLEPPIAEMNTYFGLYSRRLLEDVGSSWAAVRKEFAEKHPDEAEKPDGEPTKDEEPVKKDGEGDGAKDGDTDGAKDGANDGDTDGAKDGEGEPKEPEPTKPEEETPLEDPNEAPNAASEEPLYQAGFDVVKDQVDRELRLRGILWFLRDEAAKDESKSLREVYEKLAKVDDPDHPVCATKPGEGLIVYREFPEPLSGDELEELADSGVVFGLNFRHRVTSLSDRDLPKVGPKADILGDAGHGRQIFRLVAVERERQKVFAELTEGEKADLRDQFYLPAQARERAKEMLEELRKRCVENAVAPDALAAEAEALGGRFRQDEWIEAWHDFRNQPVRGQYWPAEFLHMRDRHFLMRSVADALRADRAKKELKAGSYLPVSVDARTSTDDPGAAYLVLLLERRPPTAETMPAAQIDDAVDTAERQRAAEERSRWRDDFPQIVRDFHLEFYGEMRDRMARELNPAQKPGQ